jgi:hypothetical protein
MSAPCYGEVCTRMYINTESVCVCALVLLSIPRRLCFCLAETCCESERDAPPPRIYSADKLKFIRFDGEYITASADGDAQRDWRYIRLDAFHKA